MRRVLLTGFEPFDSIEGNSSWEAVKFAESIAVEGATITTVQLPVTFAGAPVALEAAIERVRPHLVIAVGQAAGRSGVSVERVAVNLSNAAIPDNDGRQPIGEPILPDGPDAYSTNLPLWSCVAAAREAGVPAAESLSAGSYVCNTVFYRLMHLAATSENHLLGGFVHVPLLPEQSLDGSHPTLSADLAAKGLIEVVKAALSGGERSPIVAGDLP